MRLGCIVYRYMLQLSMIRSVRHRGLKRLIERDDKSGLSADHLPRIMDIVANLNIAKSPNDMNVSGYQFHALKGTYKVLVGARLWKFPPCVPHGKR